MPKDSIHQLSQEELVRGLSEKNRKIMSSLYKETFPKVRNYILKNSGDEDQAKDIFQEAYLSVWQQVNAGDFSPKNNTALQGFLYQVSKNKWLDFLRSRKYKVEQPLNASLLEISDNQEGEDQDQRLQKLEKAFLQLGESCKELLKLFYFKKVSLQDLAQSFGWTAQTAKNNKYRCMETLRKIIKS